MTTRHLARFADVRDVDRIISDSVNPGMREALADHGVVVETHDPLTPSGGDE